MHKTASIRRDRCRFFRLTDVVIDP